MRFAPADIISDIFKENLIEQRKSDNSGRKKNPNQMTFCKKTGEKYLYFGFTGDISR